MKRIVSAIFVFLLAVLMLFTACSKKQENPLIGTWEERSQSSQSDIIATYDELPDGVNVFTDPVTGEPVQYRQCFTFNDDGTGTGIVSSVVADGPFESSFTYTLGDGEIYAVTPHFSITCTYKFDGDKLILTVPYSANNTRVYELYKVND